MSEQHDDPNAARDAWEELHRRHVRYLFCVVTRSFGEQLGEDQVSDVVVDTLQSAFDWAGKQPSREDVEARFRCQDRDCTRRRVLGWLSVIARRLAIHQVAAHRTPTTRLHDEAAQEATDAEPPSSPLHAALARALVKLTPEETEAVRVSLPWYRPETGQFAHPRGEAAKAASDLGITPDALRQRRYRSLKRLRSLILEE